MVKCVGRVAPRTTVAVWDSGNNEYLAGSVGPPGKLVDEIAQQASERSKRALRRSANSGTLRSEMWSSKA